VPKLLKQKQTTQTATLAARIRLLRDECNGFIDSRVEEERKDAMGVPPTILRQMLCSKFNGDIFLTAEFLSENKGN
jgi:hypothetical protein